MIDHHQGTALFLIGVGHHWPTPLGQPAPNKGSSFSKMLLFSRYYVETNKIANLQPFLDL